MMDQLELKIPAPPTSPAAAATAVLCEGCGYPIDDAAAGASVGSAAGSCPECGLAIAASLPTARRGSAWQRRPGLTSWALTGWAMLVRPRETFGGIRIERRGAAGLLWTNLALAATAIVAPWSGALLGDPVRAVRGESLVKQVAVAAVAIPTQVAAVALVLFALTWIESVGIRFISARRGWRLLPDAARQICAHASIGWIACGALPLVAFFGFEFALRVFGFSPRGTIDAGPVIGNIDVHRLAIGGSAIVGYLAGMLLFETLVFLGVRRCRFANAAGPG